MALAPSVIDAQYLQAGFRRRAKRQRRMRVVLPLLLFPPEEGYEFEVIGQGPGFDGYGKEVLYDHLVVTTPEGVRVPAYRQHHELGIYNVCQELNYVPV